MHPIFQDPEDIGIRFDFIYTNRLFLPYLQILFMLKRRLIFTMAILSAILITILLIKPDRASYSDYAYLEVPRIVLLPSVKALEVKIKGDPATSLRPAIKLLHKTYRKLT